MTVLNQPGRTGRRRVGRGGNEECAARHTHRFDSSSYPFVDTVRCRVGAEVRRISRPIGPSRSFGSRLQARRCSTPPGQAPLAPIRPSQVRSTWKKKKGLPFFEEKGAIMANSHKKAPFLQRIMLTLHLCLHSKIYLCLLLFVQYIRATLVGFT